MAACYPKYYITCYRCKLSVPIFTKEIHEIECKSKKLSKFSHPYIDRKTKNMVFKVNIIKEYDVKNKSKKTSNAYIQVTEPKWKKNSKFIFLNKFDMNLCHIENLSPVLLKTSSQTNVYVAVESENVACCHVNLDKLTLNEMSPTGGLITIEKIQSIKNAKSIQLKFDEGERVNRCDTTTLETIFKQEFLTQSCDTDDRAFLFTENMKVKLKLCWEITFIISKITPVQDDVLDKMCNTFNELSLNNSSLLNESDPKYITMDEWRDSYNDSVPTITQETSILDKSDTIMSRHPLQTSTPDTRNCSKKSKRRKKKRFSLAFEGTLDISSIELNTQPIYYLIGPDCQISIIDAFVPKVENKEKVIPFFKDEAYKTLVKLIEFKLKASGNADVRNLWNGLLLSGYMSTGKSKSVSQIGIEFNIPVIEVSVYDWVESGVSEEEYINNCYIRTKSKAPAIMFIDQIDVLLCKENVSNRFSKPIFKVLKESLNSPSKVIFIAATNNPQLLPESVDKHGRFDREIIFKLPDVDMKRSMLETLISPYACQMTCNEINSLLEFTTGFTCSDLKNSVENAVRCSELENSLSIQRLREEISSTVPYFLTDNNYTIQPVLWDDIYGYESTKKEILKLLNSVKSRGIFLYGPPGCSKTMIVRAVATQTKFTYIPIRSSTILSKYAGGTEKAVRSVFQKALMSAPSLIFIDEIDSLCTERKGSNSGSVVTEFISGMQKISNEGKVFIVGATNRPNSIDRALLSPGCLEIHIHVDLPDYDSRRAIWVGLLNGAADIDIDSLALNTEGYSGAELSCIYQVAAEKMMECCDKNELDEALLTRAYIDDALRIIKPRTSAKDLAVISAFHRTNQI